MAISRRYCFTLNNWTPNHQVCLDAFQEHCLYLVFGKEVGDSGTPHLQGFFTLKSPLGIKGVTKRLGFTDIHLEVARTPSINCANYCKKDADFTEHGEPPFAGKRSDLSKLADAVKEGCTMKVVSDIDPATYIRNYRGLANYAALQTTDYSHTDVRGIWYWGCSRDW